MAQLTFSPPSLVERSDSHKPAANDGADPRKGRLFWTCSRCGTRNPGSASHCLNDGVSYVDNAAARQDSDLTRPMRRPDTVQPGLEPAASPVTIPNAVADAPVATVSAVRHRGAKLAGFAAALLAMSGGIYLAGHNTAAVTAQADANNTLVGVSASQPDNTAAETVTALPVAETAEPAAAQDPQLALPSSTTDVDQSASSTAAPADTLASEPETAVAAMDVTRNDESTPKPGIAEPADTNGTQPFGFNIDTQLDDPDALPLAMTETVADAVRPLQANGSTVELSEIIAVPAAATEIADSGRQQRAASLKSEISTALSEAGFRSLQVQVSGPVVTVSGALSSQHSKDYALQVVRNYPGVARVMDKIFVFQ